MNEDAERPVRDTEQTSVEPPRMAAVQAQQPLYREIIINKVANGFIVQVGCQTLVATRWSEVSKGLMDYFVDPSGAEKKYVKKIQDVL